MAETRSKRKARIEAEEVAIAEITGQKREAGSQRAGDAIRTGDDAMSRVLEGALRHRGRIERATHGFHTYPAGLHPDAARDLLSLGKGPVLDPFFSESDELARPADPEELPPDEPLAFPDPEESLRPDT